MLCHLILDECLDQNLEDNFLSQSNQVGGRYCLDEFKCRPKILHEFLLQFNFFFVNKLIFLI